MRDVWVVLKVRGIADPVVTVAGGSDDEDVAKAKAKALQRDESSVTTDYRAVKSEYIQA